MGPAKFITEETLKLNGCVTFLQNLGVGELIGDVALCLILASVFIVVDCDMAFVGGYSGDVVLAWECRGGAHTEHCLPKSRDILNLG